MLKTIIQIIQSLSKPPPTSGEIRQETYWLGSRHKGNVLEGALLELKGLEAGSRRAVLLRAVILKERTA